MRTSLQPEIAAIGLRNDPKMKKWAASLHMGIAGERRKIFQRISTEARHAATTEQEDTMPLQDDLGKRMKTYYEEIPRTKLMRRTPVAICVDGKAFHTYTRGFRKPFDEVLTCAMQETIFARTYRGASSVIPSRMKSQCSLWIIKA